MSDAAPPNSKLPAQVTPPAPAGTAQGPGAPMLCLAGKGPLDEATSAMLAQLPGKHGLGARYYSTSLREAVNSRVEAAHKAMEPDAAPSPCLPPARAA